MNIFIKFKEKRKLITLKNNLISVLDFIEQIKNEIKPKDEIKIEIKNFDLKLINYQKLELSKEKKLIEYNIQNNDELIAEITEKDVFSYSLVEEKQFLCNFCFSILKNPVQLNCNHLYCETCFNYLKLIQNIDKNQPQLNIKIFQKDCNSITCLNCNKLSEKKEDESNLVQLKLRIENYLNEKKKVEIVNCKGGTKDEPCYNVASVFCEKCEACLCEECSKKIHSFDMFKNHAFGNFVSKNIKCIFIF
jgi:hypothetical protein